RRAGQEARRGPRRERPDPRRAGGGAVAPPEVQAAPHLLEQEEEPWTRRGELFDAARRVGPEVVDEPGAGAGAVGRKQTTAELLGAGEEEEPAADDVRGLVPGARSEALERDAEVVGPRPGAVRAVELGEASGRRGGEEDEVAETPHEQGLGATI